MRLRDLGLVVAGALLALTAASAARADGEAGLVIQHGDGTVETFCIAFTGDSVTGEQLLAEANVTVVDWAGLVCAVGRAEGCFQPSSFDSCTCQCKGNDCTYWAYFTQKHGGDWVYSALGFESQRARDGDLQAWKWGKGGPNSAPTPAAMTFEQVCGHAPRGGAAVLGTEPSATLAPGSDGGGGSGGATGSATQPPSTAPGSGASSDTATAPPGTAASPAARMVTIAPAGADGGQSSPAAAQRAAPDDDGSGRGVIGFAVVAAALVVAIAAAVTWRRTRGP